MRMTRSQGPTGTSGGFERILLPVDLSDRHAAAVDLAAKFIRQPTGEAILLHVIETIVGLSAQEGRDFYGQLSIKAQKHLDSLAESFKKRKLRWRSQILYGHRVAEIVRYAAESKSDLIIATVPRFDSKDITTGWGSLSYKISPLAPCPVLLVKSASR